MKNGFKPKNGRVIVELNKKLRDSVEIGGKTYILDNSFRKMFHAVQNAEVIACDDECDLDAGDKVYVHHFVIEDERKVPIKDKDYRWLEYSQIYCKVKDGILETLGNYILVTPVKYNDSNFKKYSDSGILLRQKAGSEDVERFGIVRSVGKEAKDKGIKEGDTIFFNKNCEYEIIIEGERLYRMEYRDVITVVDNDVEFIV
jgi:co-chaperonin GroES (HSP10)